MEVELISKTDNIEKICAKALRSCKTKLPAHKLTLEKPVPYYIDLALRSGHLSTLEHGSATFSIDGVSRTLTHQLVRHRIASYSQQSQRNLNPVEGDNWFVTPPTIANCIDSSRWYFGMGKIKEYYLAFLDMGVPE